MISTVSNKFKRAFGIEEKIPSNCNKFYIECLFAKKKSDTLFILGSGPTINSLSDENWSNIKKHDSLAINNFGFHWFTPKYYWLEFGNNLVSLHYLLSELQEKYYNNPPIFLSSYSNIINCQVDIESLPSVLKENLFLMNLQRPMRKHSKVIKKNCEKLFVKKIDLHKQHKALFSLRSSLIVCLQLACWLRYKKIVLLGVDLYDGKYFFDSYTGKNVRNFNKAKATYQIYSARNTQDGVHRTVSEKLNVNGPPVTEIIREISHSLSAKYEIQFYSGSCQSLLANFLSVYFK